MKKGVVEEGGDPIVYYHQMTTSSSISDLSFSSKLRVVVSLLVFNFHLFYKIFFWIDVWSGILIREFTKLLFPPVVRTYYPAKPTIYSWYSSFVFKIFSFFIIVSIPYGRYTSNNVSTPFLVTWNFCVDTSGGFDFLYVFFPSFLPVFLLFLVSYVLDTLL